MDPKKRLYILAGALVLSLIILLVIIVSQGRNAEGPTNGIVNGDFSCGDSFTYQEVEYGTVEVGNQCWMAENLNVTKYADGSAIPNLIESNDWANDKEGAYACYLDAVENCNTYGALYNWYAVNNEAGLCPAGWSVPTHNQWADLERSVCGALGNPDCSETFPDNGLMDWRGTNEGLHLRSETLEGLNTYGFNAIFGGFRNPNGPFSFVDESGFWWTSSSSEDFVKGRIMDMANQGVRRIESMRSSGFSVRCVQN
ncbi:MAG: fibrobacter succinogenes major paralogous domain-containing protein [Candidatus Nealsonbacteria bacterium]|nr:fibrobacter succinogenes major paralogous domain-containing protein [Candidatus Nealsonbacteria bacterium]